MKEETNYRLDNIQRNNDLTNSDDCHFTMTEIEVWSFTERLWYLVSNSYHNQYHLPNLTTDSQKSYKIIMSPAQIDNIQSEWKVFA